LRERWGRRARNGKKTQKREEENREKTVEP
jgi:hypothetical protein